MTILVVIDGVLNDMQAKLLKEINNAYKTDFKIEDITCWEWLNDIANDPKVNEPIWWLTEREWFWDFVQINRKAVETIEKWVKQGHKVRFVTASYFSDTLSHKIKTTLEAFDYNLINERNVIVAQDKSMICGDVMIDDHVDNLKDFKGLRICYAHPWNAYCGDMERTDDWNVIDELIQNLTYGE